MSGDNEATQGPTTTLGQRIQATPYLFLAIAMIGAFVVAGVAISIIPAPGILSASTAFMGLGAATLILGVVQGATLAYLNSTQRQVTEIHNQLTNPEAVAAAMTAKIETSPEPTTRITRVDLWQDMPHEQLDLGTHPNAQPTTPVVPGHATHEPIAASDREARIEALREAIARMKTKVEARRAAHGSQGTDVPIETDADLDDEALTSTEGAPPMKRRAGNPWQMAAKMGAVSLTSGR